MDLADSTSGTQAQEKSTPATSLPTLVQTSSEEEYFTSPPISGGLPSPVKSPTCLKKTFAKIKYQYEVTIDPPEQDDKVKRDIMRFIGDNLKMEYKFNGKSLFEFSPLNVTHSDDGTTDQEEPASPFSLNVEAIKTSENWNHGRYETNMTIKLKKMRRPLEVVQDQPGLEIERTLQFENIKFQLLTFGMVLALLVGLAATLIYPIDFPE